MPQLLFLDFQTSGNIWNGLGHGQRKIQNLKNKDENPHRFALIAIREREREREQEIVN